MRRRWREWIRSVVLTAAAVLLGCGSDSSSPTSDAAALDRSADSPVVDATADGSNPTSDSQTEAAAPTLDGTVDADAAAPGPDATVEGSAPDVDSGDSSVPDAETGDDADAGGEATCAVDSGPLDDAEVALGQSIVQAHRCPTCHGGALAGNFDGVPSPQTEGGLAYPPNLTPDPTTGLGCWTDDQIENAFLNGFDNEGMRLCPPMPRFGHLSDGGLDDAQAHAVVQYLRSLPPFVQQIPNTPDCTIPPDDAGPLTDGGLEAGDGAAEAAGDAAQE